jgi:hypothetical protein
MDCAQMAPVIGGSPQKLTPPINRMQRVAAKSQAMDARYLADFPVAVRHVARVSPPPWGPLRLRQHPSSTVPAPTAGCV